MHPEYARFLSFFRNIVRIGLDEPGHVTGESEDETTGAPHVTSDDFFKDLYEDRDVVKQLLRNLTGRRDLLCLVGPRGSGKTTAIRSLQRELEKQWPESKLPKFFMTVIDLRIETATPMFDTTNSSTIEQSLRMRLRDSYLKKFFPLTRRGENPRLKLWSFVLDAERAQLQPETLFSIFGDLQDRTTALLRNYDKLHHTEFSVEEWLERKSGEQDVNELTSEVDKRLDFSHLVYAVHYIKKVANQIVWLDNADILSDKQQTDAMIVVKRLLTPISSLMRMGISIREENVFREYDISDDGAPPLETRVMVEIPRGPDDRVYYPSKDIPLAHGSLLRSIIKKRLEFARSAQVDKATRLSKEIERAKEGEVNLDGRLRKQLEDLTPLISAERFEIVRQLADKLVTRLNREGAILMANNSLRDYMMIIRDCLADLLSSKKPGEDNALNALKYEPWYLSTLYFRRIRHALRTYRGGIYDVLAATNEWFKQGRRGTGCLLSHLILVATWNHLLGGKGPEDGIAKSPRVGDIVSQLEPLGYSRKTIVENLHSLYFHENRRGRNLLEIRGRTPITTPDEVKDDMRIYITYRGKGLTARIGGSFGYLYDCLRLLEGGSDADDALIEHPAIQSTNEVIDKLLPHLCDVAQMHYTTLKDLHLNKGISHKFYMQKFGIPAVLPYRKKGEPLLQLQMILSRLGSYAKNSPHELQKLNILYDKYSKSIQALDQIDPLEPDIDFRDYMGVQPRVEKKGA